mgnify:CR=1 FL=1
MTDTSKHLTIRDKATHAITKEKKSKVNKNKTKKKKASKQTLLQMCENTAHQQSLYSCTYFSHRKK